MTTRLIRIATRRSQLALWQANQVAAQLAAASPDIETRVVGMTTLGDRNKRDPLSRIGGKGVFVKELETALLEGEAEIAVHSMKDVPAELPAGLAIGGMLARADPRDALVSNRFDALGDLPEGAVLGSSSARRCLQLAKHYPHLVFKDLRGNVDTRLRKLDEGEYDGILLATAGLERLGEAGRIRQRISADVCVPAAGQGAIGMELREDQEEVRSLIAAISDTDTVTCVSAERAVTLAIGATCTLPVGIYARQEQGGLSISAFVADLSGHKMIEQSASGPLDDASALAAQLGQTLIDQGVLELTGAER